MTLCQLDVLIARWSAYDCNNDDNAKHAHMGMHGIESCSRYISWPRQPVRWPMR
jgi:hypothetical protein